MCVCVCVSVCVYVYVYICIYICIYVRVLTFENMCQRCGWRTRSFSPCFRSAMGLCTTKPKTKNLNPNPEFLAMFPLCYGSLYTLNPKP